VKFRQLVSSPATTASGFDLICKLFSCDFELSPNFADGFESGGSFSLRRACLDSIFEFHIGDEFWQLVLSGETSPRFPRALKTLVLQPFAQRPAAAATDLAAAMATEMLAGACAGPEWPSCACRAYLAVSIWPSRGIRGRSTAPSACGMLSRCAGRVGFIRWERAFLELNFVIQSISCVFSEGCALALNIFLAQVSQLYHIVREDT
jgi:hypothetical protein